MDDEEKQRKWFENHGIAKPLSDEHELHLLHPGTSISELYEEKDLIERLLAAIGSLSAYEQLLIQKRFYDQLTLTEIARDVGVSNVTVHKRLARIIDSLSKKLRDDV